MESATILLLLSKGPSSFGIRSNQLPSTEIPNLVVSRKCFIAVAAGTAFTVDNCEVSFDGETWIDANGVTPAGATFWYCRFAASTVYSTSITRTTTLGETNYPFTVRTKAEPQVHLDELSVEEIDAMPIADIDEALI